MSSSIKFTSPSATERIIALTNQLKESSIPAENTRRSARMATDYKFQGWMGLDKDAVNGRMVWQEFKPKPWTEADVDLSISHTGVCGSDLHTLRSGWAPTMYPCCVGHEIVGTAVKVGSHVKHIKVGDRCGVGAQSSSCLTPKCKECSSGQEQFCSKPGKADTYNGKYLDGSKSYGGYADYWRGPGHFVVKIPETLSSAEAAPMLCAGVTTWTPLKRNGAGPGKKVGILGVGGLGHFAILWAKALGCDKVVAISRTSAKQSDAKKMGADHFIATQEDPDWASKNERSLDLIISTIADPKMPIQKYLRLLQTHGQFIQVGAPEDTVPGFNMFALIAKGAKIGGSMIGSPKDIVEMLDFAAMKGIHPFIEERPLEDANKVVVDMGDGKARYRYVLVNGKHATS